MWGPSCCRYWKAEDGRDMTWKRYSPGCTEIILFELRRAFKSSGRLSPHLPSSLSVGCVFLPTLYQKCWFSCCALQEENVSCGKLILHAEIRV